MIGTIRSDDSIFFDFDDAAGYYVNFLIGQSFEVAWSRGETAATRRERWKKLIE